jgi:hypothetical protein
LVMLKDVVLAPAANDTASRRMSADEEVAMVCYTCTCFACCTGRTFNVVQRKVGRSTFQRRYPASRVTNASWEKLAANTYT